MNQNLFASRMNYYSQNGEDGIIEQLLLKLGIAKGVFVELGAWNGKHWSNTYNLISKGWRGCLIEADKEKFAGLCRNIPSEQIIKVNAFVTPSGSNSLDKILRRNGIDQIDLLSIDVDSDDLAIWEGVTSYAPAIVVIEYNQTIPFDTRYVNPLGATHGNSALSIFEAAEKRSYALVEGTDANLIFVRKDALAAAGIKPKSLQDVYDQTFQLRYFFAQDGALLHNYDEIIKAGVTELVPIPWAFTFATQPVPKLLRLRSDKINFYALLFSLASAIFRCPLQLVKLTRHMVRRVTHGAPLLQIVFMLKNKEKLTALLKNRPKE